MKRLSAKLSLLAIFIAGAILAGFTAHAGENEKLTLTAPAIGDSALGGLSSMLDQMAQPFLEVFSKEAGVEIKIKEVEAKDAGPQELNKILEKAFAEGGDLIWLSPEHFLDWETRGGPVELLAIPGFDGEAKIETCLFSAAGAKKPATAAAFKGKSIAAPYDWIAARNLLSLEKIDASPDEFFGKPLWLNNPLSMIYAPMKGASDVALLPKFMADSLSLADKRIEDLAAAPCAKTFGTAPVLAANSALAPELKTRLRETLAGLHKRPKFVAISPMIYQLKFQFIPAGGAAAAEWRAFFEKERKAGRLKKLEAWEKTAFEALKKAKNESKTGGE